MAAQLIFNGEILTSLREVHCRLSDIHQSLKQPVRIETAHTHGNTANNAYNFRSDGEMCHTTYAQSQERQGSVPSQSRRARFLSTCRACAESQEAENLRGARARQRNALWALAKDLARKSVRHLKVTDLPLEALHGIFASFKAPDSTIDRDLFDAQTPRRNFDDDITTSQQRTRDVSNCRLTCRLFHDHASRYLLPWLKVSLNEASLHRAIEISRRPQIAAGIRGVEVQLTYHYPALAGNIQEWASARERGLDMFARICGHYHCADQNQAWRDRSKLPTEWHNYVDGTTNSAHSEFGQVLARGHREYQRRSVEQLYLIANGNFVRRLAIVLAKLPRSGGLEFTDSSEYEDNVTLPKYQQFLRVLDSTAELDRYLCRPDPWWMREITTVGVEVSPAKVMVELPIAMKRAGAPLEDIWVRCFPRQAFYVLHPRQEHTDLTAWHELEDACQNLRSFRCLLREPDHPPTWPIHLRDRTFIDGFLAAMLSGPKLQVVELQLDSLCTGDEDGFMRDRLYEIGGAIAPARWTNLRILNLSQVSFHLHELEKACSGLGRGMLDWLRMSEVQLKSGCWKVVLDSFRDRVRAPGPETLDLPVSMVQLEGHGLQEWYDAHRNDHFDTDDDLRIFMPEELSRRMELYVAGITDENPLVDGN